MGIRRRLPPILYHVASPVQVCEFDHPGYYNSCTKKSCSFGGPADELVLAGSDDFNVYVWRVPRPGEEEERNIWRGSAQLVLSGHRSIVNQVRSESA